MSTFTDIQFGDTDYWINGRCNLHTIDLHDSELGALLCLCLKAEFRQAAQINPSYQTPQSLLVFSVDQSTRSMYAGGRTQNYKNGGRPERQEYNLDNETTACCSTHGAFRRKHVLMCVLALIKWHPKLIVTILFNPNQILPKIKSVIFRKRQESPLSNVAQVCSLAFYLLSCRILGMEDVCLLGSILSLLLFFFQLKSAVDVQMESRAAFWVLLQQGRQDDDSISSLCIKRKSNSSAAALKEAVRGTNGLLHFSGGHTLGESMSPVPAAGHEEQHLADAAETILQRGEGQERQLGSAL